MWKQISCNVECTLCIVYYAANKWTTAPTTCCSDELNTNDLGIEYNQSNDFLFAFSFNELILMLNEKENK